MHLGKRIKELREEKKLLSRSRVLGRDQLAASLEIETPMFSPEYSGSVENGEPSVNR